MLLSTARDTIARSRRPGGELGDAAHAPVAHARSVCAVPEVITDPARIPVPGGKVIDEYVGRVASGDAAVSVARMAAPPGWSEPGQRPAFDEVTLVLRGSVIVEDGDGGVEVRAGQAVVTRAGEWVRYSAGPDGADYVAVCTPAFSPEAARRDDDGNVDTPGRHSPQ
jgi:quercetin dioxygenase-like cupin family protein